MKRIIVVALLAAVVVGCGFTENRQKAEAAVERFHAQFNDAKYSEIYTAASDSFRASSSQADVEAYLAAVRRKIGAFKESSPGSVNVNTNPSGTFVELRFESRFEQDSAVEEFVFLVRKEGVVLQRYNINSKSLILK